MRDSFHLVQRAWAAYQSRHYDLAEQEARGALALEPNDAEALSVVSLCAMQRNEKETAVLLGEQARGQGGDQPVYHYRLARIHAWFGDHQHAELPLDKALALDPTFAPAYALYAWVYYARGHLDIALKAIHEALKFDPHEEYALTLRIELLKQKGSRKLAERAAHEALAVNPENEHAHAMAGMLKLEGREHESGIHHLREAVRLDPTAESVRRSYACALEERGLLVRQLIRLSRWLRQPDVGTLIAWGIIWLVYLSLRQNHGAPITWSIIELLAAAALHVLLVIGWWGPLISYFALRDVESRRVLAAEIGVRDRMRLVRPWHVCISLAIVLSFFSLLIPGPYIAPLASGFGGCAIAFRVCELPESRGGKSVAWLFTGFVVVAAIAWATNPHSLLSEKQYPRNALAQSFPAIVIVSLVAFASVRAEVRRKKGFGI